MTKQRVARIGLVVWLALTAVVAGETMATHEFPLPVGVARAAPGAGQWSVTHVVALKCPCSRRVFAALLARGANPAVPEAVVLLDERPGSVAALEAKGFSVQREQAARLQADYGVQAAPVLIIRRPDGSVAYQGAYAPRRTLPPRDVELLAHAQAGEVLTPYPLFGCAVSRELQQQTDPLGLKY